MGRCYEEAIKSLARPGEKYSNAHVDKARFISTTVDYTSATNTGATTSAKGLLCVDLKKFSGLKHGWIKHCWGEISVSADFATLANLIMNRRFKPGSKLASLA
jgi:hypothetical protein